MKKILALSLAAISIFVFVACDSNKAPGPESDSQQNYDGGTIPVDDNIYTITGTVLAPIDSLTRQTAPAQGAVFGVSGIVSGYYTGPSMAGKGFLRIMVSNVFPDTGLAISGSISIVKTSDSKALALESGDIVELKCRAQYEAVAAVRKNETFDAKKVETWELDYCRLASPIIDSSG